MEARQSLNPPPYHPQMNLPGAVPQPEDHYHSIPGRNAEILILNSAQRDAPHPGIPPEWAIGPPLRPKEGPTRPAPTRLFLVQERSETAQDNESSASVGGGCCAIM